MAEHLPEGAVAHLELPAERRGGFRERDDHRTARGITAEQRTLRAAQHLQLLDTEQ